jgi:hypothetical protein
VINIGGEKVFDRPDRTVVVDAGYITGSRISVNAGLDR